MSAHFPIVHCSCSKFSLEFSLFKIELYCWRFCTEYLEWDSVFPIIIDSNKGLLMPISSSATDQCWMELKPILEMDNSTKYACQNLSNRKEWYWRGLYESEWMIDFIHKSKSRIITTHFVHPLVNKSFIISEIWDLDPRNL